MKIEATKEGIKFSWRRGEIKFDLDGENAWLILTPKQVLESQKQIQNALFDYKNLTDEKIDKPDCH